MILLGRDDDEHRQFPKGGDRKRHYLEARIILGDFREHVERENLCLIEFLLAESVSRV